jgi:hypothetical protein
LKGSRALTTGILMLGVPRLIVPLVLLAAFGWMLNMCHPACPVDPLTHQMECLQAADPEAWERAVAAEAGIQKTHEEWQSYADGQELLKRSEAAVSQRHFSEDNARPDDAAANQIRVTTGHHKQR